MKQIADISKYYRRYKILALSLLILLLLVIGIAVATYILAFSGKSSNKNDLSFGTTFQSATRTITRTPYPTATVSTLIQDDRLTQVYGMTIDEEDNLYVIIPINLPYTSAGYPLVYKITPAGNPTLTLIANLSNDNQGSTFQGNQGICYFNNSLYVPRVGQLTKIDLANSNLVTRFAGNQVKGGLTDGLNATAYFSGAMMCVTDQQGNIYVGEDSRAIRKVSPIGRVNTMSTLASKISLGYVLNGTDSLVFSAFFPGYLMSFDLNTRQFRTIAGNITNSIREGPANLVLLNGPNGVTFDELGNLYFSQMMTHNIWKLNSTNHVNLFAGSSADAPGHVNGFGTDSKFSTPRHMVFDSKGRIFVADQGNAAVRMINW